MELNLCFDKKRILLADGFTRPLKDIEEYNRLKKQKIQLTRELFMK
jgi:hypothetical protein